MSPDRPMSARSFPRCFALVAHSGVEGTGARLASMELPHRVGKCKKCQREVDLDAPGESDRCAPYSLPLYGDEYFVLKQCQSCSKAPRVQLLSRTWSDVAHLTLYNLYLNSQKQKLAFSPKEEIIPFVRLNWNRLCVGKEMMGNWESAVTGALSHNRQLFAKERSGDYYLYCYSSPASVKQNLEAAAAEQQQGELSSDGRAAILAASKRKRQEAGSGASKRQKVGKSNSVPELKSTTLQQEQGASEIAVPKVNDDGLLVNPDGSLEWPRFYLPNTKKHPQQRLVKENSAPQMTLLEDGTACSNDKGYRMARCSWPATAPGVWYCEVRLPEDFMGHCRLGWSTEKGDCQAPVGFDCHSWGYRDIQGTLFHRARKTAYGEEYGAGDTVGMLLRLTGDVVWEPSPTLHPQFQRPPPKVKPKRRDPDATTVGQDVINEAIFVTASASKDFDSAKSAEKAVPVDRGSCIVFYKNGVSQGVAAENILAGTYYVGISLFQNAKVHANFGPDFAFPVPEYGGEEVKDLASAAPPPPPPKEEEAEPAAVVEASDVVMEEATASTPTKPEAEAVDASAA